VLLLLGLIGCTAEQSLKDASQSATGNGCNTALERFLSPLETDDPYQLEFKEALKQATSFLNEEHFAYGNASAMPIQFYFELEGVTLDIFKLYMPAKQLNGWPMTESQWLKISDVEKWVYLQGILGGDYTKYKLTDSAAREFPYLKAHPYSEGNGWEVKVNGPVTTLAELFSRAIRLSELFNSTSFHFQILFPIDTRYQEHLIDLYAQSSEAAGLRFYEASSRNVLQTLATFDFSNYHDRLSLMLENPNNQRIAGIKFAPVGLRSGFSLFGIPDTAFYEHRTNVDLAFTFNMLMQMVRALERIESPVKLTTQTYGQPYLLGELHQRYVRLDNAESRWSLDEWLFLKEASAAVEKILSQNQIINVVLYDWERLITAWTTPLSGWSSRDFNRLRPQTERELDDAFQQHVIELALSYEKANREGDTFAADGLNYLVHRWAKMAQLWRFF